MRRLLPAALLVLTASFFGVQDVAAQERSGFIIGFGLGGGRTTLTADFEGAEGVSFNGVASDFKIGGVVGNGLRLYYVNKVVFYTPETVDIAATGMSGIGLDYPLPSNPAFYLNGALGIGVHTEISESESESLTGLGVIVGGGYHLNDLWMLDLDFIYGKPGDEFVDLTSFGMKVTINILSR